MEQLDLRELHKQHMQALRRLNRRTGTLKSYGVYIGAFFRYLEERELPLTLTSLDLDVVEEAQDWLRSRSTGRQDGLTAAYTLVMRLKAFSRWLWRRRIVKVDPLARLERPRVPKVYRQPYTQGELKRMLWSAQMGPSPVMERALLLLALDTGCRVGELCALELGDVDLDRGIVVFRNTKNGRPRRVIVRVEEQPEGGPCVAALRAWLAVRAAEPGVQAVFLNRSGYPLSADRARYIWHQLGESAEVENAIPHRGRHTHATELLAEIPGGELHLRNRLGQVSREVLADYVTISDPMAQRVANVAILSAKWNL